MTKKKSSSNEKPAGDKITVGNVSGQGIAIGRDITVSITRDAMKTNNDSQMAELESLIQKLNDILQQVPLDRSEDAKAIAEITQTLIHKANEEKPNKPMLQITGDALKQAARNIADVAPVVLQIASQIVTTISMLTAK